MRTRNTPLFGLFGKDRYLDEDPEPVLVKVAANSLIENLPTPSKHPPIYVTNFGYVFRCPSCGCRLDKMNHKAATPAQLTGQWIDRREPVALPIQHAEGWITSGNCPGCGEALACLAVNQWAIATPSRRNKNGFSIRIHQGIWGGGNWSRIEARGASVKIVTDQFPIVPARDLDDRGSQYWAWLNELLPALLLSPGPEILQVITGAIGVDHGPQ